MIRNLFSRWIDGPVPAGVILALGCTLAFAPDPFLLMVARAFLWQWSLCALVVAIVAFSTRRWWSGVAAVMVATLLAFPPGRTVQPAIDPNGAALIRVTQMNVFQPNDDHEEVIAAAIATDADVISFQEVSPSWATVLRQGLAATYPYQRLVPRSNCYGIALFSRVPFLRAEVLSLQRRSMLCAEVETSVGPVRLLSVHATSPGSYGHYQERNAQLKELAALVNKSPMPVVLFGDLNTVSWDRALVELCSLTGLREHADNTDATWPSFAGMALIPLDHILVTRQLAVDQLGLFNISGSDHRGVTAVIRSRT